MNLYQQNIRIMIKYETMINSYYWILDGMNKPIRLRLVGYNHNETTGLFAPPCDYTLYEGMEISRKFSKIFRTEKEALISLSKND